MAQKPSEPESARSQFCELTFATRGLPRGNFETADQFGETSYCTHGIRSCAARIRLGLHSFAAVDSTGSITDKELATAENALFAFVRSPPSGSVNECDRVFASARLWVELPWRFQAE